MTSKISLRGNATPHPHPQRVALLMSVASPMIRITCGLALAPVPRIILGLETRMETENALLFDFCRIFDSFCNTSARNWNLIPSNNFVRYNDNENKCHLPLNITTVFLVLRPPYIAQLYTSTFAEVFSFLNHLRTTVSRPK